MQTLIIEPETKEQKARMHLWKFFIEKHGLTLSFQDMHDIARCVDEYNKILDKKEEAPY